MTKHQGTFTRRIGLLIVLPLLLLALLAPGPLTAPAAGGTHPPLARLAYADTIDLSSTTESGPGYTVDGTTKPYNNPAWGVADPNRILHFTAGASGKSYLITQTGIRNPAPDPLAPKQETGIFGSIIIDDNVAVRLVFSGVDHTGYVRLSPGAKLDLRLEGQNYVRRHITVPPDTSLAVATLTGLDADGLLTLSPLNKNPDSAASIGGDGGPAGEITINSGTISITARSTGAGIGGAGVAAATGHGFPGGNTTINGGVISISQYGSGNDPVRAGAGIGGGTSVGQDTTQPGPHGGVITINDGLVTVRQYGMGSAIGGGAHGTAGDITIKGGTVDAEVMPVSNAESSAIGAAAGTSNPGNNNITIAGGTVRAVTSDVGAGIGDVNGGRPVIITITGGDVTAKSVAGSGIGAYTAHKDDLITLTGGTVIATSAKGAAIGDTAGGQSPMCLGSGANVRAYSGQTVAAWSVKDNQCDGYYVNARLDKVLSTTQPATLVAHATDNNGPLSSTMTLPAGYPNFGFASQYGHPRFYNIQAATTTTPLGTLVRSKDSNPAVYSIHDVNSYHPHLTSTTEGVLPVKLSPVSPGIPFVTDVTQTTATFHSVHQMVVSGTFVAGGFIHAGSDLVDNQGKLKAADAKTIDWAAFSANEITADVSGLAPGRTYYMQTFVTTSSGQFFSVVVKFTTAYETRLDLSATTASGGGYTVTGVGTGDEYATRFPAADATIDSPTGVLTFTGEADARTYSLVQSGVLAAPADPAAPKRGTAIFREVVIPNGVNVTLALESIDLIGTIRLEGGATATLVVGNDTADSYVRKGIFVPLAASLTIDAAPGASSSALTVTAEGTSAAAIGSPAGLTGGAIAIRGGAVTASSRDGAGIDGTISIDARAHVHAYSASSPAIKAGSAGNLGDAYLLNARLDQPLPVTGPAEILVFPDGYDQSRPADRIDTLTLPGGTGSGGGTPGWRSFAYTAGAEPRTDNLYANLGFSQTLGRVDYRVIDALTDNAKPIPASTSANVVEVKLRQAPVAGTVSVAGIGQDQADLTSTGHRLGGQQFVSGGFVYSPVVDPHLQDPPPPAPVYLPWAATTFTPAPVTVNTSESGLLVPNTRYQVNAFLIAEVDLYLDQPVGQATILSDPAEFVTLPRIAGADAAHGDIEGEALVSAVFDGGHEAIAVTVTWSMGLLKAGSAELSFVQGQFGFDGFTGWPVTGLVPGHTYDVAIQVTNETGADELTIRYQVPYAFSFYKVDPANHPLVGVSFTLSACTPDCGEPDYATTSHGSGLVSFVGLDAGTYLLKETATLPGYALPPGAWLINFDPASDTPVVITATSGDGVSLPPAFKVGTGTYDGYLVLPNYAETLMPELGGPGSYATVILGVLLVGCAVAFSIHRHPTNPTKTSL